MCNVLCGIVHLHVIILASFPLQIQVWRYFEGTVWGALGKPRELFLVPFGSFRHTLGVSWDCSKHTLGVHRGYFRVPLWYIRIQRWLQSGVGLENINKHFRLL